MRWTQSVALGLLVVLGVGCTEVRYTIRQADSHRDGGFFTMQTSAERVTRLGPFYETVEPEGINYWRCGRVEGQMNCTKVCEDMGSRVCAPYLAGHFGQVNLPPAFTTSASSPALYQGEGQDEVVPEAEPAEEGDVEETPESAPTDEAVEPGEVQ
ncbi:hypothetical protein FRC98_20495 [Lujinxingia vulgaris]|uniref:Uncharacterized protein n=1 Tax=Lujinxingia vulgaris TaxID=2600176 RepID=A0A5C6X6K0_9DELT|nr:hypothetical protein [Lujinxingia vulgaris]TXD33528.1 hypothetical protein FRC98_20495 [Lujinxingia vulgaris]